MSFIVPEDIADYAEAHTTPEPPHLTALAQETRASLNAPQMLSGPVEGRFLQALVFSTGAKRILEIGTYSGYSALSMAGGLPEGGRITTLELSEEHAEVALRHIEAAGESGRIKVVVGPALESLARLSGPWDLVFIDADKPSYRAYYEAVLPDLSPQGLIAVDNTLWSGRVLDPAQDDASGQALAVFNDHLLTDDRVVVTMLTIRDGITLIRRA